MVRAAPALMKYRAWRSVYGVVSSYVRDERLRQALSFHTLLVGGNPMTTSAIYALIHTIEKEGGVWFARGGTNALVSAMVRLRSEEHTSELQSLMRISYAVFCLKKKTNKHERYNRY